MTVTGGKLQVDENSKDAFVGEFNTEDQDVGDKFTYQVLGTAANQFYFVNDELFTKVALDYEKQKSYTIQVKTTDSGSLSYQKQFIVSVNNVNEKPSRLALTQNQVSSGMRKVSKQTKEWL